MKIQRAQHIQKHHFFYIAFFIGYFFLIYFLLYHPNGLSPFQINIHFFSNAVGSICKRFLVEATPYALLFFLIYHSKRSWLRITCLVIFLLLFAVNLGSMAYYFVTRTDVQYYVLQSFRFNLFIDFIEGVRAILFAGFLILLTSVLLFLLRIRASVALPATKKAFFIILFTALTFGSPFIPVVYSQHKSVLWNDILEKKLYRLASLETSGVGNLLDELAFEHFTPSFDEQPLSEGELAFIDNLGLDRKLTQTSAFRPKKIILIVTESLSQSFVSHYNPEIPEITPFIDSLIETYPHVDAFYPSGSYTLYGLAAGLCSHLNTGMLMNGEGYDCLPNLLKNAGYYNEFIRGFSKYYLRENLFFNKIGYDSITALEEFDEKYPDYQNERPELYDTWGFSDNYLFDEVIQRLKEKPDERMFLTVLTVDTHAFGGRCHYVRSSDDPENDILFSVNCFDRLLADFFDTLESEGLFDDDLLVILTSDQLYPVYSAVPGDEGDSGFTAKPGRIPFVFISKKPTDLIAPTASQLDIAPTLLDLLNIDAPDYYLGKSMLSNTDIVPMGRNDYFVYIMPHEKFMGFNLFQKQSEPSELLDYYADYQMGSFSNMEDFERWINEKRRLNRQSFATNNTLLKWLRNHWYKNPSSPLVMN